MPVTLADRLVCSRVDVSGVGAGRGGSPNSVPTNAPLGVSTSPPHLIWGVWPERGTRVADGVFRLPSPPQGIREPATEAEVRSLPCWNGRASWEAHLQWEAVLGRAAGSKGSSSQAWRDGQWYLGAYRTQEGGGLLDCPAVRPKGDWGTQVDVWPLDHVD